MSEKENNATQGLLIRQLSADNRVLREALGRTSKVMADCLRMLDNAGMGKPDSLYGNTLYGMVFEACERLRKKEGGG